MIKTDHSHMSPESHQYVEMECDFNLSPKCKKTWYGEYRNARKTLDRNNNQIICLPCSRYLKASGRNNPNCKYNMDDNLFEDINTEEKAYILGYIASDGHLSFGNTVSISSIDTDILHKIKEYICPELKIKKRTTTVSTLTISSRKMRDDICGHLEISAGKKCFTIKFPELDQKLVRHFVRGFFDGDGHICSPYNYRRPRCGISSGSDAFLKRLQEIVNIPCSFYRDRDREQYKLEWNSNNALDFMGYIYNDANIYMDRKYVLYHHWSTWIPSLLGQYGKELEFHWSKCKNNAVSPSKERASDSGYDITIIDIVKDYGKTKLYGTGIKICPEYGWYFDLVARSSIVKTGYILTNSVGIIDRTYTGELLVALTKIDDSKPDIELPVRIAQIIPRPIVNGVFKQIDKIEETERNDGGFGSTGK